MWLDWSYEVAYPRQKYLAQILEESKRYFFFKSLKTLRTIQRERLSAGFHIFWPMEKAGIKTHRNWSQARDKRCCPSAINYMHQMRTFPSSDKPHYSLYWKLGKAAPMQYLSLSYHICRLPFGSLNCKSLHALSRDDKGTLLQDWGYHYNLLDQMLQRSTENHHTNTVCLG